MELANGKIFAGVVVLRVVSKPESDGRAKIAPLKDDAFRKNHTGM